VSFALRRMAVCLQRWPQLVAIYLVGLLARDGAIGLAAWAGHDNDVWASLIMPLAVLARLGALVAMLLVLRPCFPELSVATAQPRRPINVFASVIVPAFAIYLGWQMFKEDWLAFEARALGYRVGEAISSANPAEVHFDSFPNSRTTVVIIIAALVIRLVLRLLGDNLPRWTALLKIYIDSLWVFLVLTFSASEGVKLITNPGGWVKERRVVVWLDSVINSLIAPFHPLQVAWQATCEATRLLLGSAAVPLIWLVIAGIVYGVSTRTSWVSAGRRVVGERADTMLEHITRRGQKVHSRWQSMPEKVREKTRDDAADQLGKYRPIAEAGRLIAHAGVLGLAVYVLAYLALAWLDMSGSYYSGQLAPGYLFRGMAKLLGPHPFEFWAGIDGTLKLLSHIIIEPLRVCVVATAFAYCVHHASAATATATADLQREPNQNPTI